MELQKGIIKLSIKEIMLFMVIGQDYHMVYEEYYNDVVCWSGLSHDNINYF